MTVHKMNMNDIKNIGTLIQNQYNRGIDQPIFLVQQKVKEWGYNIDYGDDFAWVENKSGNYREANEEEHNALQALAAACEKTPGWNRLRFRYKWEFVTACFTEQGCKDYIKENGHNMKEARIYAWSSSGNVEFQAVRRAIIDASVSS